MGDVRLGKFGVPTLTEDSGDYLVFRGAVWRVNSTPLVIPAAGNYLGLSFRTPMTGYSIYQLANFAKTGDELQVEFVIGGTIAGGSALSITNLNHNYLAVPSPFTELKFGLSTAGYSVTGGVTAPGSFIPGIASGLNQLGSTASQAGIVVLKPDTVYCLKIIALGTNTKVAAWANLAWITE